MTSTAKFAFAHDSEKHLDPQQISLLEKETVTKEPNIEVPLEPSGDKRKETPFETAVLDAYIKGGSTIDQIAANMGIEEKDVIDVLSGYAAGKFRNRHFSPALHDRVVDFALAHPEMSTLDVGKALYLRRASAKQIINGVYYCGLRHSREDLKARWEQVKNLPHENKDAKPADAELAKLRADLDKALGIAEDYRKQIEKYHAFEHAIYAAIVEMHRGDGAKDAEAELAD